jgi:predicted HicB family RNase H-like nuclease
MQNMGIATMAVKRGRPPAEGTAKRTLPSFSIRLEPDVRDAVERAAKADRRSLASWVEIAIIHRLTELGLYPPKPEQ